jgi:hypothetical protein
MEDLKRKLDEYERRDAAASLEMQRAARSVQAENMRLRDLLRLRGVSDEEIHGFLGSHGGHALAIPDVPYERYPGLSYQPTHLDHAQMIMGLSTPSPSIDTAISTAHRVDYPIDRPAAHQLSGSDTVPNSPQSNHPTPEMSTHSPGANALESSCDAAAAILVQLHKQTDPTSARVALGCEGPNNCSVRNTTLFQLMDA